MYPVYIRKYPLVLGNTYWNIYESCVRMSITSLHQITGKMWERERQTETETETWEDRRGEVRRGEAGREVEKEVATLDDWWRVYSVSVQSWDHLLSNHRLYIKIESKYMM